MSEQNYGNHSRYHVIHHFVIPIFIAALIGGSVINLKDALTKNESVYSASLICLVGPALLLMWMYYRSFALKAQDRAIRAEENFRHYILTGKPLDRRLRMGQIVALRFASDDELPALAKRTVDENLGGKAIKMSIKNWKEDNNRV